MRFVDCAEWQEFPRACVGEQSSDEKLQRLREFGAMHLINYQTGSFDEAISSAIGRDAVDLVIDTVGGKILQESVNCLRYGGRIISLGVAGRDFSLFNPLQLWGKNASLIGMSLLSSRRNEPARTYDLIADCIARVASGELRVVIAHEYALADAAKAHAHSEQRSVFGRIVMRPRGG
jgi:NADPH2:quinone reductase